MDTPSMKRQLIILCALMAAGSITAVANPKAKAGTGLYMVIDLSGGPEAEKFPVTYLNKEPPGGWTDEYKTTKLVLRRIKQGSFTMGSPKNEVGRPDDKVDWNETQHKVTISRPFYIGVFEVTQKQFNMVLEDRVKGRGTGCKGDMRPMYTIGWDEIRGSGDWPTDTSVRPDSFIGILRAKTGLDTFDLPTEAMWEYACRAGTATALNNGKNLTNVYEDSSVAEVGRYNSNTTGHARPSGYKINPRPDNKGGYADLATTVGLYKPNAWGLYDMHGNVSEWCLDWLGPLQPTFAKDPVGPSQSNVDRKGDIRQERVVRGGAYDSFAEEVRSASRNGSESRRAYMGSGFRLCCFTELPKFKPAKGGKPAGKR